MNKPTRFLHLAAATAANQSQALLDRLLEWSTQPQFVVRHHWRRGDLVIWDNTGLLHRARPYSSDSPRLMHRTTIAGQEVENAEGDVVEFVGHFRHAGHAAPTKPQLRVKDHEQSNQCGRDNAVTHRR